MKKNKTNYKNRINSNLNSKAPVTALL